MKIRNGFVSNSSSSSFIVSFPKKMKSLEDVKNALFPDGKTFSLEEYNWNGPSGWIQPDTIADEVWKDIQNNIVDLLSIACEIGDDNLPGYYDNWSEINKWKYVPYWREEGYEGEGAKLGLMDEFDGYTTIEELEEDMKKNDKIESENDFDKYPEGPDWGLQQMKEYLEEAKEYMKGDKQIYLFSWSDDTGYWSAFEHGDVFRNLPHKQLSHH